MRSFYVFLIALSFTSCITKQKCSERFPPEAMVHDSIHVTKEVITVHDTVQLPAEAVIFTAPVPCPDFELHETKKQGHLTASVDISKGKIQFKCAADSLQAIVDKQNEVITIMADHAETKVETKEVFINHWYDPFCRWFTIIGLATIGIGTAWKIGKSFV